MRIVYQPKGPAGEYARLACNLYTGGCPGRCAYCYAPAIARIPRQDYTRPQERPHAIEHLTHDAHILAKSRLPVPPIFFCFLSDPYPEHTPAGNQPIRRALVTLYDAGLHWTVLTKYPYRALRDLDLYRTGDALGASLTVSTIADWRALEPGTEPPNMRLISLKIAHQRGVSTWASLEPVIDPDQTCQLIEESHAYVDLYRIGKLNHYKIRRYTNDWADARAQITDTLERVGAKYVFKTERIRI